MVRGVPGGADRELIGRLAALGVVVSGAQLERWRAAGLLPGHGRRWLGRGRGSVSVLAEETVAVAAALGRHARPGRDLRWTVIAWYAGAGLPAAPGELAVPEPPWPAVREALVWAMGRSHAQRLVVQARAAGGGGEEAQDAFYAEAGRVVGRGPAGLPHPEEVRRVIEDPGAELGRGPERERRRAAVYLAAAAGMGAGEVGGEVLVEALAVLMPGVDWAPVAESARQAEGDGTLEGWGEAGALIDPLARLQAAGEAEMAAARGVARILTLIGFLYVMHGLLMPDSPFLARLRARVDESGFALVVSQLVAQMGRPSGVPHALVMCLSPEMAALAAWLEALITEQAGTGQGLLRLPGAEEDGAEAFMQAWIGRLHDLTDRARARRTGAEETSGRSATS
ncbi:hypothetical protein [Streptomyces europaeiscabiei]|uniref:hypothetical protein n=1 Tax=Streptomyces europaeiscabiei TaxID=146819 RepID=UPI002E132E37|nr:hypothetical protein OHB30_00025 [Streptomyces europaeiscabiei]WSG28424.1 hypothetical protein OHB30_50305 [Streptomyces europaeiscabiei]